MPQTSHPIGQPPALVITDTNKLTLAPGKYPDPKKKGLKLVVSPKGKRVWYAHVHSPTLRKSVTVKLGLALDIKVPEARVMLDKLKVEHAEGQAQEKAGIPTFREVVESYNRDWVTYHFDTYFNDWLPKRMNKLTADEVSTRQRFILTSAAEESNARRERAGQPPRDDAGEAAVSMAGKALRAVYNHAFDEEKYKGKNLGRKMALMKDKPRKRWLDDEQEARLLAVLDNPEKHGLREWSRIYFRLLLATGSRKTALVNARWEDIDMKNKVWTVPSQDAKNGEDNHVQLGPTAIKLLQEQKVKAGASPFVFPSPSRDPMRYPMTTNWQEWEVVRDAADLAGFTPHDLRRTFGSKLVSRGAPMKVVAEAMNHKQVSTTEKVYGHIAPEAIHKALQLLE